MFCGSPSRIHPAGRRPLWVILVPTSVRLTRVSLDLLRLERHWGVLACKWRAKCNKNRCFVESALNAQPFRGPDRCDASSCHASRRLRIVTSASSNPPLSNCKPRFLGFAGFRHSSPAMLAAPGEDKRGWYGELIHITSAFNVSRTVSLAGGKSYFSSSVIGIQRKGDRGGDSGSIGRAYRKWMRRRACS
jgi:hypothetical protein